jgi:FkbM family methyltransferase
MLDAMSALKTLIKLILGKGVRNSYSQSGEDLVIRSFLPEKKGVYVDIGCYHPILYSNTYRLYREGWHGIVVDPNPALRRLFRFFRSRDTFVNAGIGKTNEVRTYFRFKDGAYNTFDPESAKQYEMRTKLLGSSQVNVRPLREVLAGIDRIDLMNVDTEGLDLEVLESYDWRVMPRVIIIEAMPGSPAAGLLEAKGYGLVGLTNLNSIYLANHRNMNSHV